MALRRVMAGRGPRAAAWTGLGALLAAVAAQKLWSADTWTLLAIGRWVVRHRGFPRVEEWTWTGAGHEWIELRWLFCAPMYLAYQWIGEWAPSVMAAGMVGLTIALVVWPSRRALGEPAALLVVALGLIAGMTRWVMRPELVTYLMVAAFLVLLDGPGRCSSAAAPQRGPRCRNFRWWLLPLLQVIWTNSHALFVFGPILAWTWVGREMAGCGWARICTPAHGQGAAPPPHTGAIRSALLAAAVTVACWVNPYLTRGALMPLLLFQESSRGSVLSTHIEELQSVLGVPLSQWRWDMWAAFGLAAIVAWTFIANRRRFDPARAAVFAMGLYLAAGAQRNVGLLAVMAVWAGLRNLEQATSDRQGPPGEPREAVRGSARLAVGFGCAAMAWYVATDRYWASVGAPREFGVGVVQGNTAEGAADFVLTEGAQGRLYNGFGDGGYLIWRCEGRLPVYVDGRTEVHDAAFWEDYFGTPRESWSERADRLGINTAIVPRAGYDWLLQGLARLPGWVLVYADRKDAVFVRQIPAHAGIIARHRLDPAPLTTPIR